MKQLIIFFTLFFGVSLKCFSCMCLEQTLFVTKEELKEYDFIAHVFIQNDDNYKIDATYGYKMRIVTLEIKILELLKGDTVSTILEYDTFSSCDLGIFKNEEWLLFAKKNKKGKLSIGACSRAIKYRKKNGQRYSLDGMSSLNKIKKWLEYPLNENEDGDFKTYYKNGQLELLENYENGQLNGTRKIWYPNGQMMTIANYKNGELNGKCLDYFENGQIEAERYYSHGKQIGISKYYYKSGQIKSERYEPNEFNEKALGIVRKYFEIDTNLIRKELMQRYEKSDTLDYLYSSPVLKSQYVYDNKRKIICSKDYDRLGILEREFFRPNNEIRTKLKYHPNGRIAAMYRYKGEIPFGRYQSFFENGLPDEINSWNYDENGNKE